MIRRSRRSVPASLVALMLLAGCVLVVVSCLQSLTGHRPWLDFAALASFAAGLTVRSPLVLAVAVLAGVAGLALLGAALTPGSATVLPLEPGPTGLLTGVTQRSLTHALAVAAGAVDGVDRATIRVGARRVRARVRTPLREPGPLAEQVRAAITRRLADVAPTRTPRVRVRVRRRSD